MRKILYLLLIFIWLCPCISYGIADMSNEEISAYQDSLEEYGRRLYKYEPAHKMCINNEELLDVYTRFEESGDEGESLLIAYYVKINGETVYSIMKPPRSAHTFIFHKRGFIRGEDIEVGFINFGSQLKECTDLKGDSAFYGELNFDRTGLYYNSGIFNKLVADEYFRDYWVLDTKTGEYKALFVIPNRIAEQIHFRNKLYYGQPIDREEDTGTEGDRFVHQQWYTDIDNSIEELYKNIDYKTLSAATVRKVYDKFFECDVSFAIVTNIERVSYKGKRIHTYGNTGYYTFSPKLYKRINHNTGYIYFYEFFGNKLGLGAFINNVPVGISSKRQYWNIDSFDLLIERAEIENLTYFSYVIYDVCKRPIGVLFVPNSD